MDSEDIDLLQKANVDGGDKSFPSPLGDNVTGFATGRGVGIIVLRAAGILRVFSCLLGDACVYQVKVRRGFSYLSVV
jgi:hypothetical protein